MADDKKAPEATEENGLPDAFGRQGRARSVAEVLAEIQKQRFELEVAQVVNDLADDDPAPGGRPGTIAQARERFDEAEARVMARFADMMDDVRAFLGQQ